MRFKIIYHRDGTQTCTIEGQPATAAEIDAQFPARPLGEPLQAQTPSCWPMLSDGMACHPDQIHAMMARNKKHGLHVDYDPKTGCPILMDRGMRRDLLRIEGFHDRHAGYGD